MQDKHRTLAIVMNMALFGTFAKTVHAAQTGDFVQTDNLGMNLITRNFSNDTTKTIANAANLIEFVGLHGYVSDTVRLGLVLQFSERITPAPPEGASRLQTFALLPQVGWVFWDPFYTALVFTYAPRTDGIARTTLGLQGVFGATIPISERIKANLALEVPWNFHPAETLGLTPLAGIAILL